MPFFGLFHLQIAFVNIIYSLWRAPKCTDFAHLTAIIKKLQRTAFTDEKKIKNFRAAEDLLITTFTSYIVAWVTHKYRSADWVEMLPQKRRDWAATYLNSMGTEWMMENTIPQIFDSMFSGKKRSKAAYAEPCRNEVFHQAAELISAIGIYLQFREAIHYGRVGELTALMRLMLPYFAGSSSHKYTKELAVFLTMEHVCDESTWHYILDNLLVKAKGDGFQGADCRMERLIRKQKTHFREKGQDFESMASTCSLISAIMDEAGLILQQSTSKREDVNIKRRTAKKRINDEASLSHAIIEDGILDNPEKPSTVPPFTIYSTGITKLQSFDLRIIYDEVFGRRMNDDEELIEDDAAFDGEERALRTANIDLAGACQVDDPIPEDSDIESMSDVS